MKWSVIYDFDLEQWVSINGYKPQSGKWEMTEGDEQFEGWNSGVSNEQKGKHRKYIGYITDKAFRLFLDNVLYPYHICKTLGMLGAMFEDGMEVGLVPAFSLSPDIYDNGVLWQNAYVLPVPENDKEIDFLKEMTEDEMITWIKEEYIR